MWREHERLLNYRAGLAPWAIIESNRGKKRAHKTLQPLDFFEPRKVTAQTDKQILLALDTAYRKLKHG